MKRVISILLTVCVTLACAPLTGVAAVNAPAGAVAQSGENYPFVLIRGIAFDGLYANYGTDRQEKAIKPITAGDVLSTLGKAAATGIVHRSMDKAVDEVIGYAREVFEKLGCNKDGTSTYNIGLPRYPLNVSHYREELIIGGGTGAEEGMLKSAADRYGAENVYYFTYDWRLNPLDICDEINDMVNLALTEHSTDKVNLVNCSMGGIETIAYLSKYGYGNINKCVFLCSTFYGLNIVSDVFSGKISVEEEALYAFLDEKAETSPVLRFAVKISDKTGLLKLVSSLVNRFVDRYKDKVFEGALRDTFGTMPVWWGLTRPDAYDEAVDYIFDGHEEEYADLIAIGDDLQAMMAGRDRLLKEAASNGVQIAVIANYNGAMPPVTERAVANSDGGLETALVSGGAVVADYGKTLGDDYVPSNPAYLSPDRVIDASTCLFPDCTWFVKDAGHVAVDYGSEYSDFLFWIVDFDGQPTVWQNPRYPQFMKSGREQTLDVF